MECAAHLTRLDAELLEEVFNLAEDGTRVLCENSTSVSEQDPLPPSLEEFDPERYLQITHLL